jgi:hypothetical protein
MAIKFDQLTLIGNFLEKFGAINHTTIEPLINTFMGLYRIAMIVDENTRNKNKAYIDDQLKDIDINAIRQQFLTIGVSKQQLAAIKEEYYANPVEMNGVPLAVGPFKVSRKFVNIFFKTLSVETSAVMEQALRANTDQKRAEILFDYFCNEKNQNLGFCKQMHSTFFKSPAGDVNITAGNTNDNKEILADNNNQNRNQPN